MNRAPDANSWIIRRALAQRHHRVRQVRQRQQNRVAGGFYLGHLFVQRRNAIANLARLLFPLFRFVELFLAHQCANLLGDTVALGLQLFDFDERLAPLLVERQHLANPGLIPCPARGQPFPDMVRLFANQLNVEHGRSMQAPQET